MKEKIISELKSKWYIAVIVALAAIWQGALYLWPQLPNPFKF